MCSASWEISSRCCLRESNISRARTLLPDAVVVAAAAAAVVTTTPDISLSFVHVGIGLSERSCL